MLVHTILSKSKPFVRPYQGCGKPSCTALSKWPPPLGSDTVDLSSDDTEEGRSAKASLLMAHTGLRLHPLDVPAALGQRCSAMPKPLVPIQPGLRVDADPFRCSALAHRQPAHQQGQQRAAAVRAYGEFTASVDGGQAAG